MVVEHQVQSGLREDDRGILLLLAAAHGHSIPPDRLEALVGGLADGRLDDASKTAVFSRLVQLAGPDLPADIAGLAALGSELRALLGALARPAEPFRVDTIREAGDRFTQPTHVRVMPPTSPGVSA